MKIIFATTNNRKLEDLINVINEENLDLEVLSLNDIGWNLGEIDENGSTIEENSLIKAKSVFDFCKQSNIDYPIVTDDAGLFVNALGGQPGIYTARYADEELAQNPNLPKHYVLLKLLDNLQFADDRSAEYRCAVTIMFSNGEYKQFTSKTKGYISNEIAEPIKKPYFYSLFIEEKAQKPFNQLNTAELKNTYRFKALKNSLIYLGNQFSPNDRGMI